MRLLISECWLEFVSSATSGEDRGLVFKSVEPVFQSYIFKTKFKSSRLLGKLPGMSG
jgi:hypothetical protein